MSKLLCDGRCDGCGRHVSQLKPFGKDLPVITKKYRWDAPHDEKIDKIMDEFFEASSSDEDCDKAKEKLIEKYGQEEAEGMMFYHQLSRQVGSSWECQDCICLSSKRFHRMRSNIFYG
jgi:hypothetical protein